MGYTYWDMAPTFRQSRIIALVAASLLCLGSLIVANDWSYRLESGYRDLQVNCYRLATGWQQLVGDVRGLVYVFRPLPEALATTRSLQGAVFADLDPLERSDGQGDAEIATSVRELAASIRAGLGITQGIIDAAATFLAQPDLPAGIADGRLTMAGFLGRDVGALMSQRTAFNYFQLVRRVKEMNAFFDELYSTRLDRLLGRIVDRVTVLRQAFLAVRLAILGLSAAVVAVLVWQLWGMSRFMHRLAEQANAELATTRADLSEAKIHLQDARFQQSLFEMVTGVSHELNTPLGNSITVSTFLADSFRELADQADRPEAALTREAFLRKLRDCGSGFELLHDNLGRMKTQIDTFKQLAAANHAGSAHLVAAARYLEGLIPRLAVRYSQKVEFMASLEGAGEVPVSPESLDPVISELVANSVIHGQASRIDIGFSRAPGTLTIRVADNGRGIGDQDPGKLAEPFYTTARGRKHMGLGLSIATSIVSNRLGGTLSFETGGPGLVAVVVIPLTAA